MSQSFFPFSLTNLVPCLPVGWTTVQDWLHLVLLCGIFSSVVCVANLAIQLSADECRSFMCFTELMSSILILPSTMDFIAVISSYDEQLKKQQERHREHISELKQKINAMVIEMNSLVRKMAQHADHHAKSRFLDKLSNFKRFLKHYSNTNGGPAAPTTADSERLHREFKHFVEIWVTIFARGLFGSSTFGNLQDVVDDIRASHDMQQLRQIVTHRIDAFNVRVRFLQRAEEPLLAKTDRVAPLQNGDVELETAGSRSTYASWLVGAHSKCGMTWVKCGKGVPFCGYEFHPGTEDRMPQMLHLFRCLSIKILSKQHRWYLLAFFMDVGLLIFEMFCRQHLSFILVFINAICLASMLLCFEQIDEIARIERQTHILQIHSTQVSKRHEDLKKDWEKADQFHELWKYRTLPLLSIMDNVQDYLLEDECNHFDSHDRDLECLTQANSAIASVEQKLGSVEGWLGDQVLSDEWKGTVGKRLLECERMERAEIPSLLNQLPDIVSKGLADPSALAGSGFPPIASGGARTVGGG